MPELPEVETTRRGIEPWLVGRRIETLTVREWRLRWRVPRGLPAKLGGARVRTVGRRAKYLLIGTDAGTLIWHLGMSGSLRVLDADSPPLAHDYFDLVLDSGKCLRFNDPRRFGCLLWQPAGETHELLQGLGPEPLSDSFDGDYLFALSRGRKAPIKAFLMDQAIVVGVGNIYVAEALFEAGVSPLRAAGRVSRERYQALAAAVKRILAYAIERGGTTLRDFIDPDGTPGYFEQELRVYGREGDPCRRCRRPLRNAVLGNRASVYCAHCQR